MKKLLSRKEKKIEGIAELRDESDKDGMRIVIEMKRGEMGDGLNNLSMHKPNWKMFLGLISSLWSTASLLNLKELLEYFVLHRREVVNLLTVSAAIFLKVWQ